MANKMVIFIFLISLLVKINCQVLNPNYFNIAEGRKINASSTCGEGQRDLYCRLVGSNFGYEQVAHGRLIMGQSCDWCDSSDPAKSHKAEYITDGTDRWWQSPPLSRDLKYAQVNLTLDLDQEFHIAYILLKMGNSPRPDVWVLERSSDFGKTWSAWQYFAPTKDDCIKFFGNQSLERITRDDSVICETKFSKIIPLENGEITVKLVSDRPGASNFSMSPTLQQWSKATNIRLRFLRPKTTLEDLVEGARRDKTVTRRYFYSLKDINIGGRCVCNGHANVCNILDPQSPFKLFCNCKHHTCGAQCDECCPGFEQKKWKPSTVDDNFECEPCNCFGHSENCTYEEDIDLAKKSLDIYGNYKGGGVCFNCRDNTKGINCNECVDGHYRRKDTPLDDKNICAKCQCNESYHTGNCAPETAECECKKNFNSPNCDSCAFGYVDYPTCRPCDCYINGTTSGQCEFSKKKSSDEGEKEGETEILCPCKENFDGPECRKCAPKFYSFPNCTSCECEKEGSVDEACDQVTGKCNCKNNFDGVKCQNCRWGYFKYPKCTACNCDVTGTTEQICDENDGKCICKEGYYGERCEQCAPGFFGYPNCQPCGCYEKGSLHDFCSPKNGKCTCLVNYDGRRCDKCKPGFFNSTTEGCVSCACDIHGSLGLACNSNGKCSCKENYDGDKCSSCRKNYFVYPFCERCECNLNGIKETFVGCDKFGTNIEKLCDCKERVTGRKCSTCKSLYWKLNKYNPLGCQECQCLTSGTVSGLSICHSSTGQCMCKNAITGRVCNTCADGYWKQEDGHHFGCSSCECSVGGSEHPYCLKNSGKCSCKVRITGRTCDRPIKSHYFPTLYQYVYEMEDATTPQGTQARYEYDEKVFPDYSWKGYANYSDIQKELYIDAQIDTPSIYRPVISYINSGNEPVNGQLILIPISQSNSQESAQANQIQLEPTNEQPKKHLVPIKVGMQSVYPLKAGRWRIQLKLDKPALVDYVVLLPEEYWNSNSIIDFFELPCMLVQKQEPNQLCKHYSYPDNADNATSLTSDQLASPTFYEKQSLIDKLTKNLPTKPTLITENGQEYKFTPKASGKHKLVINYHHFDLVDDTNLQGKHDLNKLDLQLKKLTNNVPEQTTDNNLDVSKLDPIKNRTLYERFLQNFIEYKISNDDRVTVDLTKCIYSFSCKQVIKTLDDDVAFFDLSKDEQYQLSLKQSENSTIESSKLPAIIDLTLIPIEDWSFDYVKGEVVCSRNSTGHCIPNEFLDNDDQNRLRIVDKSDDLQSEVEQNNVYTIDEKNMIDLSQSNFFNSTQLMVIASGNVSEPKLYTFVIEYYQPYHASYDAQSNIILNSGTRKEQNIPSKIPIKYCRNVSGCKTQIVTTTNGTLFELNDAFDVAVMFPPGKSIFIKKINVIPNEKFQNTQLTAQPTHLPQVDFFKECAQDAYFINATLYNNHWNQTSNSLIQSEREEENNEDINKVSKFCRDTVYGLTVKFNKGALPCNCDKRGSTSYDCAHFGGQCLCKPHVIGRSCTQCKIGYYGFPNCQRCNCPTHSYCEPKTGRCICPPRVTGNQCNTCMAHTFGYHPIIGCQECNCHSSGVQLGNLQCDINTGACACKKNIAGRRCNVCLNGFYSFPQCTLCSCDKRGANEKICDSSSGQCFCKPNTSGDSCEQCKEDSFNLDENNPSGCSKCWCSGVSSKCRSSDYVYIKYTDMLNNFGNRSESKVILDKRNSTNNNLVFNNDGWTATKLVFVTEKSFNDYSLNSISKNNDTIITDNESSTKLTLDENRVSASLPESERREININQDTKQTMSVIYGYYFRLPSSYLGKKLTSYGGQISYSVSNIIPDNYEGVFTGPDVILVGNNITVIHEILEQPITPEENYQVSITLTENSFKQLNGALVAREKFLQLLNNVTAIYLKGVYFKYASVFSLNDVSIDIGSNDPSLRKENSRFAKAVEQCFCPKGYHGPSCDECSSGYYKILDSKGARYCIPCKCNGHSQECDVNTGICKNCLHNTTGQHCEQCVEGYYGDSTRGTSLDCMICPCPLAMEGNNFATSCKSNSLSSISAQDPSTETSLSLSSQFTCKCKRGYTGPICEQCDKGYFGRPFVEKDYCKSCDCNGNVDLSVPGACDSITGRCLLCQNNTYGDHCEQCAPYHFGDAINAKNCKKCACSRCGSTKCDHETGICECKPNVQGQHCSECDANHWGFESCNGCRPCNCGVGSTTPQCDSITGSCSCKNGVGGSLCDRCLPGFFNLTDQGCTDCNCKKKYSLGTVCENGQCKCLPNVIGSKCDGCPPRWIFLPGVGCQSCTNCIHGLLDYTDELKLMLDEVMSDMGDSSSSMLANRKLNRVNETVINFKNRLAEIFDKQLDNKSAIDSLKLLKTLQRNGSDIESLSKKLIDLKQSLIDTSRELANNTNTSSITVYHLHTSIYHTKEKLAKEIQWVKSLASTLIPAKIINEEAIVQKGQIIMSQLKQIDLTDNLKQAYEHLNASDELSERITKFQEPWLKIQKDIEDVKKKIERFNQLINDLNGWIEQSGDNTVLVKQNHVGLTNIYKDILVTNKKIHDLNATIENLLQKAKEQNEKSKKLLDEELSNLNVDKQYEEMLSKHDKMREQFNYLKEEEMEKLQKLILNAVQNIDNVNLNASKIVSSFKDTKKYSLESVQAANSYSKMKDAIEQSKNLIEEASYTNQETGSLINIGNKTERSKVDSYNLKTSAMNNQVKINNEIGVKLNATKNRLNDLNFKLNDYFNAQKNIRDHITNLQNNKLNKIAESVISTSDQAIDSIETHKSRLNDKEKLILDQLESQTTEFDGKVKNGSSALKGILAFHRAIDSTLPNLIVEIDKNPAKLDRINRTQTELDQSLNSVKKSVKNARALANRLDLGLEIKPNTYVELRPPLSLLKPGTYNKLSLYFKPTVSNGLIAYLGNPKSIRSTAQSEQFQKPLLNDYLALELRAKRVALIMDVGSEPLIVFHDQQVQLNKWHFVEVEVIGKHVQLKLRLVDQPEKVLTAHLGGTFTVFNLDRLNSKLYLGGIPKNIELQDKIENVDFDGEIQQVVFGETKLGLWNFVSGKNNNKGIFKKEAAFKNSVVNTESNEIKFNGKAYAQIDSTSLGDIKRETNLLLQFRTLSNEGLIFLVGGERKYLAIEIGQGRLLVKIDLEDGYAEIGSRELVNDGNWHDLTISRLEKTILMKLDGEEDEKTVTGRDNYLETDGQLYFGGYPNGGHQFDSVTNVGFNGCLRSIQLDSKLVRFDDKKISPGAEFGCSENVVRELSFEKAGFITMPPKNDINQISLKFRTKEQNGLLFFASNRDLSQYIAIYLNRGILVFQSKPGELISSSTHTERQFNDNIWHYLTATRTQNIMRLDLDDKYVYQPERQQRANNKSASYDSINLDNDLVYFGGVNENLKDKLEALDIPTSFIGCLGDVNLNEEFKNFAFSKLKSNVQLVSCLKETEKEGENEETSTLDYSSTSSPDEEFSLDPRTKLETTTTSTSTTTTATTVTTTTTEEPDISGKKHRLIRGCKLPVKPNDPKLAESINGLRYGARKTSRTEIKLENSKVKEIERNAKIDLKLKPTKGSGLLLLLADKKFIDHTLLYLLNSKLYCSFNLGSGNLVINTEKELPLEQWTEISIRRESKNVKIKVGEETISEVLPGDKTSLNVNPTLYVGGVPNEFIEQISSKIKESYGSFEGCINDIRLNDDYQVLDLEESFDDVESCDSSSSSQEDGIFFKGQGYLQLEEQFIVGNQKKLMLDLKPRTRDGIILYAQSSNSSLKDFLLLELVDGALRATVNNGGESETVSTIDQSKLPNEELITCDGSWRHIEIIKSGPLIILSIDDYVSEPIYRQENDFTADTDVLYVGGCPDELRAKKPYLQNINYSGCLRSFRTKNKDENQERILDLTKSIKNGKIELESCPTV